MAVHLGIDYGKSRIGIAVSDPTGTIATAYGTHHEGQDGSVIEYINNIIADRNVEVIVIGLPLTADGRETEIAIAVRDFAKLLETKTKLPVYMCDERYSSQEADKWIRLGGGKRHDKGTRDRVAAEIILQQYLDQQENK